MKILIPLTYFGRQGGYRVLSEFANQWIEQGHEVEFLAYKRSMTPGFPTKAKISYYDIHGNISSENQVTYKKPLFRIFSIITILLKVINKMEYDVILATLSLTAFPVFFSKKHDKKFYYVQAYEPDYFAGSTPQNVILRWLSKTSYQLNLKIIVNSPLYFDYHEIKTDRFVFPGIDFSKFKPLIKPNANSPFVMGCIGRIEPYKGTSFVLEAYQLLRKELGTAIELHVAFGDESLECMEGVKIIKCANDVELGSYYAGVSVIVAPGTVQLGAIHYPVIEAMACAVPVITTGYYPADDTNSWIVPIKNSESIKEAVMKIMNNKVLTESKIEKAFADIQEFEWTIVSNKMLSYFV